MNKIDEKTKLIIFISNGIHIAEIPPSTSMWFMDGKWGKLLALITGPNPYGIKRVELVTSLNLGGEISRIAQFSIMYLANDIQKMNELC